jgi:hypothetical protein
MIDTGTSKVTYAWLCADQQCDTMSCYKDKWNSQTVCELWTASQLTEFHDAELSGATKKINAILSRLQKGNSDESRKLSFIKHDNRLMLVWAEYGRVGPEDDFKDIKKALKLRGK